MSSLKNYFFIIAIILISISIFFSKNLRLDASSDTLVLKNDESFQYYEYYNEIFPSKNFLILAIKSKEEIDKHYINNINNIKSKLDQIQGIESNLSIVDIPIFLLNNITLNSLANRKIENINNTDLELNLILSEFANSPVFKDQIINTKKNISSIIIYLNKNEEYEKQKLLRKKNNNDLYKNNENYRIEKQKYKIKRKELILQIREIIANQNNDYKYYLGGIDMISSDTINFVKNDILVFSIAVVFFIIIVLFTIYREIKWVLIPLISTSYSVLIMTGFMGLMKWEITAISANFISLMLILSISMNIHIINNYRINYSSENIYNSLRLTLQSMFWPCFYTALTTIVAFASLLFSDIKPVIDFGNIMIIALLFIFITSFTILPLLIFYFPKIEKSKTLKFSILDKFSQISLKQANKIIIINFTIFIISIFGIYKLNVENSFINYFKSNTDIYKGMKLIDTELGGTTPIDILIQFKDIISSNTNVDENIDNLNLTEDLSEDLSEDLDLNEDFFIENEPSMWITNDKLNTIKKIHEYLEARDEIGKVQSLHSLIEMANLINNNELSIFELSILYNEMPDNYKENFIKPFLSIDNNMVKITARIKDSNNIKRDKLITEINSYIKNDFNNINNFRVNGLLVLYNNMLQSLFNSQIKSFGIILISIFLMFLILFKSLKLSLIGIIPNIIASSFILGLIGLLGIPLNIMTITIAAITIGIAVDNTIHYIYRIKQNYTKELKVNDLIEKTHTSVGHAVLTTSLTIAFGFSVLSLSSFIPTILFGIFTALAMLIAMIGVLITLPSIITKFKYDY